MIQNVSPPPPDSPMAKTCTEHMYIIAPLKIIINLSIDWDFDFNLETQIFVRQHEPEN